MSIPTPEQTFEAASNLQQPELVDETLSLIKNKLTAPETLLDVAKNKDHEIVVELPHKLSDLDVAKIATYMKPYGWLFTRFESGWPLMPSVKSLCLLQPIRSKPTLSQTLASIGKALLPWSTNK